MYLNIKLLLLDNSGKREEASIRLKLRLLAFEDICREAGLKLGSSL